MTKRILPGEVNGQGLPLGSSTGGAMGKDTMSPMDKWNAKFGLNRDAAGQLHSSIAPPGSYTPAPAPGTAPAAAKPPFPGNPAKTGIAAAIAPSATPTAPTPTGLLGRAVAAASAAAANLSGTGANPNPTPPSAQPASGATTPAPVAGASPSAAEPAGTLPFPRPTSMILGGTAADATALMNSAVYHTVDGTTEPAVQAARKAATASPGGVGQASTKYGTIGVSFPRPQAPTGSGAPYLPQPGGGMGDLKTAEAGMGALPFPRPGMGDLKMAENNMSGTTPSRPGMGDLKTAEATGMPQPPKPPTPPNFGDEDGPFKPGRKSPLASRPAEAY